MTTTQMYWLTRASYFQDLFNTGTFMCLAAVVIVLIVSAVAFSDGRLKTSRYLRKFLVFWLLPFLAIMGILTALIPSTKEMAAIYIIPKIVNNAKVQEIPDKMLTLANEWLEELRPESKTKK